MGRAVLVLDNGAHTQSGLMLEAKIPIGLICGWHSNFHTRATMAGEIAHGSKSRERAVLKKRKFRLELR